MHRLVMPPRPGFEIDHINLDRLDNRKANLREATHCQNVRNTGRRAHSRWPYKGVRYNGASWTARIRHQGRELFLGAFASAEDAARAYDRAARIRFGCFARTNNLGERATRDTEAIDEGGDAA
ncbi:MAG: HNH endonuclease [Hyphomicrobiales bacterium]